MTPGLFSMLRLLKTPVPLLASPSQSTLALAEAHRIAASDRPSSVDLDRFSFMFVGMSCSDSHGGFREGGARHGFRKRPVCSVCLRRDCFHASRAASASDVKTAEFLTFFCECN